MFWHVSVHPSVCPHGGTPIQPWAEEGTHIQNWTGVPLLLDGKVPHPTLDEGGTPSSLGQGEGVPHPALNGGYPLTGWGYSIQPWTMGRGYPHPVQVRVPLSPSKAGWKYALSQVGYPSPLSKAGWRYLPIQVGYPHPEMGYPPRPRLDGGTSPSGDWGTPLPHKGLTTR